jgi:hypothetical protein
LQPALTAGHSNVLDTPSNVFGLVRRHRSQQLLCLFNLSDHDQEVDLSRFGELRHIHRLDYAWTLADDDHQLLLGPWSAFFANIRLKQSA